MYVFEEVNDKDFEIIDVLVHVLFGGATEDNYQRRLLWGYHDILWIMKHRYKLNYKEQLFVIFKMAEYSDTVAYMKAYKCSYKNAQRNAHKMKNRPHVYLTVHEAERVMCSCVVHSSFEARLINIERQFQKDFGKFTAPMDEINDKLKAGEKFRWTAKQGFIYEEKKVITNNESEDSEYTMSQMERDELERLREENKNLTELVQDQARDIFELKNILDEIRNNKASSDIYICKKNDSFEWDVKQ